MPSSDIYNDKQLLLQIANGDEKAFAVLYHRYRDKVFAIAYKLTRSEPAARDVMQEIFMKLWVDNHKLAAVEHFTSYLNTLTRNSTYNALRKQAHEETLIAELLKQDAADIDTGADAILLKELKDSLLYAVTQLPPQQKKVFELSRLEGLKHEQIAERLHISRETVKKHIMQAMLTIRAILVGKGHLALLLLAIK